MHRQILIPARQPAVTLLAIALAAIAVVTVAMVPCTARAQETQRAPVSVKDALGIMARVVADSDRLIASHSYEQLPRESNEFEAGLTALEQGVGSRPSQLRSKLEPLIAKARVASSAMSEAARARRDSMLPLTHRQLADAVSAIIAEFPADLRPDGEVGAGPRAAR